MLSRGVLLLFVCEILMVAADYGLPPNIPKLIIKEAGPSKEYPWVGYTHHYPSSVPHPLLLHKWHPYMDPTYTAFWVSRKPNGGGGGGYGGHRGHVLGAVEGKIPHGFGAPKPSSIASHGSSYQEPDPHFGGGGTSIVDVQSIQEFHGGDIGFQVPHQADDDLPIESYNEPQLSPQQQLTNFVDAQPIHIPQDNYVEPEPQITYQEPVHLGQPILSQTYEGPSPFDSGNTVIQTADLVHNTNFNQYSDPHQQVNQPDVVPLVKLPDADPLPLENEGNFFDNSILQGNYNAQGNFHR